MRVVLADIERPVLEQAANELAETGADVVAIPTDVSLEDEVNASRRRRSSGSATSTCSATTPASARGLRSWSCRCADFEWVINVNLFGVVHGAAGLLAAAARRTTSATS